MLILLLALTLFIVVNRSSSSVPQTQFTSTSVCDSSSTSSSSFVKDESKEVAHSNYSPIQPVRSNNRAVESTQEEIEMVDREKTDSASSSEVLDNDYDRGVVQREDVKTSYFSVYQEETDSSCQSGEGSSSFEKVSTSQERTYSFNRKEDQEGKEDEVEIEAARRPLERHETIVLSSNAVLNRLRKQRLLSEGKSSKPNV